MTETRRRREDEPAGPRRAGETAMWVAAIGGGRLGGLGCGAAAVVLLLGASGCMPARVTPAITSDLVVHRAELGHLDDQVLAIDRDPCDPAGVVAHTAGARYALSALTGTVRQRVLFEVYVNDPVPVWDCASQGVAGTLGSSGIDEVTVAFADRYGSVRWTKYHGTSPTDWATDVVTADLDHDGAAELYVGASGRVVRLSAAGEELWSCAADWDCASSDCELTYLAAARGARGDGRLLAATRGGGAYRRRVVALIDATGRVVRTARLPGTLGWLVAAHWPDGDTDTLLVGTEPNHVLVIADGAGHVRRRHQLPPGSRSAYWGASGLRCTSFLVNGRRHLAVLACSKYTEATGVLAIFGPDLGVRYEQVMGVAEGLAAVPDTADSDALLVGERSGIHRYTFEEPEPPAK